MTEEMLRKRIDRVTKAPNYFTMVIRGHFVVEQLLNRAIEKYSRVKSKEIERLPFGLKTEFAVALGVFPKDSHPLYKSFNSLRNRFAHNPFATFRATDSRDMANCLSDLQKQIVQRGEKKERIRDLSNREFVWRCILAMYAQLHTSIRHKIRETIANEMVLDDVSELVAEISKTEHSQRAQAEFQAKVDEAVKKVPLL